VPRNDPGHGIGMHRYEWRDHESLTNIEGLLTVARLPMATEDGLGSSS
jgi:hypothetical protein